MNDRHMIADALLDLDAPAAGEQVFVEDFDSPPPLPPEPEVIEPTFSAAELDAARNAGFHAGRAAALAEAAAADHAAIRQSVETIAGRLASARDAGSQIATQSAEAMARLLLDSFALALPALCANHGDAELSAAIAALLPALAQEPAITVRVHPRHAAALSREIERLDPDAAARCRIIGSAAMAPGDLRVAWRNGGATRDVAAVWAQVMQVLGATGLSGPAVTTAQEVEVAG